ncbi:MAG: hypothetical protein ACRDIV_03060 [Ktedonobacteraceae bacterium]
MISRPRALVIREGQQKRIAGREVVPGDILMLATGMNTEPGKIGKALESVKPEETRLQRETGRLVMFWLSKDWPSVCSSCCSMAYYEGTGSMGYWPTITLAMSVLPEEFPVVLTIFLTLGAWRLAQRGARPGTNGCSGRGANCGRKPFII